ncbi:hypothetical protein N7532_008981 [Penicillium argentinense]|uniref:Uncharacterized protein n=1 Tax=Penicillium argentinense TaxID=1131581 RepID=A0A9W9EYF3_9EURO|nr:uncharacterized protein N7532_008981 [Penicillium argentinense]KAJ5090297.1 hypothetical protein N7532_008981 [Penicillium argentinense]
MPHSGPESAEIIPINFVSEDEDTCKCDPCSCNPCQCNSRALMGCMIHKRVGILDGPSNDLPKDPPKGVAKNISVVGVEKTFPVDTPSLAENATFLVNTLWRRSPFPG